MQTLLGLDIGSHTMKIVELKKQGNTAYTLLTAASAPTPPKVIGTTPEFEIESFAQSIQKFIKDAKVKSRSVHIALPESQVFTRVIEVPQLSRQELASSLKWEAEQYIPLPLDQVNMDFAILREAKDTMNNMMQVLLVAAPKTLIDKYVSFLELAGLAVVSVETEIISATRAILPMVSNTKTAILVSLGAQTTDLAILRDGVIAFTRSISAGGEALSRALVQILGFKQHQAEEFKRTYGLNKQHLEGRIVEAVKPIMDTIISEIKRSLVFYQEKYKTDQLDLLILSGGTAKLPGIVAYMKEYVGVDVQIANPWIGIQRNQQFAFLDAEAPMFTVAAGLARL